MTEFNFDEPNLIEDEEIETIIRSVFNENEADFLIMTLENFPSDVNGGNDTVTNGCWFCWRGIPGTETPCEAVMINGEYTGDFAFTVQVRRHGMFGIPRGPIETAVLPY